MDYYDTIINLDAAGYLFFHVVVDPFAGLVSLLLLNPFSVLFTSFVAMVFFLVYWAGRHDATIGKNAWRFAGVVSSVAVIITWVSLWISERDLTNAGWWEPYRAAGFPLPSFFYPHPALGSDIPPLGQWLSFFTNFLIIFVAVFAIALAKKKTALALATHRAAILLPIGAIIMLAGLGFTLLKFD